MSVPIASLDRMMTLFRRYYLSRCLIRTMIMVFCKGIDADSETSSSLAYMRTRYSDLIMAEIRVNIYRFREGFSRPRRAIGQSGRVLTEITSYGLGS